MLVLSRRPGETVVIESSIRVTVVAVQGNRVRLAVCAPDDVRVDRQEIHQQRAEFAEDAGGLLAGAL
jgi:carbon storage regulator